jgi:hypothetical protein
MIKFKEYVLKEEKEVFGPPNEEKFEMWDRVKRKEMSEDEFLKLIGFERVKPNSRFDVEDESKKDHGFFNVNEYFQNNLIHRKSFWEDGEIWEKWWEWSENGIPKKHWDNRGNEKVIDEKIDEEGRLTKINILKEYGNFRQKRIEVFAKKRGDKRDPEYYYYENEKGVKDESKFEYKYDENSNLVYFKQTIIVADYVPKNDTYEKVMEYWENGKLKNENIYENGELNVKRSSSYTQNGTQKLADVVTNAAKERAKEYNEKYHGIFLHSVSKYDVRQLIEIKEEGQKAEICVSTLRSNTVFQSGVGRIVIVGFGNIRELYDYDSYSERDEDGTRYATKTLGDSLRSGLHDMGKDYEGYNEEYHYDEGFMDFSNAEVVAVFADYNNVINNWVCLNDGGHMYSDTIVYKRELPKIYKEYKNYVSDRVDKIKAISFKECIKKIDPNIKVIGLDKFNQLQNSEELMRLMYKLKEEKEASDIMDKPLQPYEEKTNFKTFKNYIIEKTL